MSFSSEHFLIYWSWTGILNVFEELFEVSASLPLCSAFTVIPRVQSQRKLWVCWLCCLCTTVGWPDSSVINHSVKTLQTALVPDHQGLVNFAGNTQKRERQIIVKGFHLRQPGSLSQLSHPAPSIFSLVLPLPHSAYQLRTPVYSTHQSSQLPLISWETRGSFMLTPFATLFFAMWDFPLFFWLICRYQPCLSQAQTPVWLHCLELRVVLNQCYPKWWKRAGGREPSHDCHSSDQASSCMSSDSSFARSLTHTKEQ